MYSITETIDELASSEKSIARFGDGEFLLILEETDLPFQSYDPRLSDKLKTVLASGEENILVGLPSGFHGFKNMNKESITMWKSYIVLTYPMLSKFLNKQKKYYNSSFTRFYFELVDKTIAETYQQKIKAIWEGKEVLIVEGEKSRLGVGNDLLSGAASVERILAPKHNAFSKYDELVAAVEEHGSQKLILLALGPTATVFAYDLAQKGYRAIDIGNVDIEYEWFLKKAKEKEIVPGKYTSEVKGGRDVADVNNEKYEQEIIREIK